MSDVKESLLPKIEFFDPMGKLWGTWGLVCGVHTVIRLAVSPRKSGCFACFGRMRKVLACWLGFDSIGK
jgi:hypothetical protein